MRNASEFLWEKASETLFITRDDFMATLAGWKIETIIDNGEVLGVTTIKGPELHFVTTGKSIPRRVMRKILEPIFDEHGYVTTRTPKHQERQHRFNLAWGFVKTGED